MNDSEKISSVHKTRSYTLVNNNILSIGHGADTLHYKFN